MAALDYDRKVDTWLKPLQQHTRKHGFIHDIAPLLLVAVVCFLVVALDVKL